MGIGLKRPLDAVDGFVQRHLAGLAGNVSSSSQADGANKRACTSEGGYAPQFGLKQNLSLEPATAAQPHLAAFEPPSRGRKGRPTSPASLQVTLPPVSWRALRSALNQKHAACVLGVDNTTLQDWQNLMVAVRGIEVPCTLWEDGRRVPQWSDDLQDIFANPIKICTLVLRLPNAEARCTLLDPSCIEFSISAADASDKSFMQLAELATFLMQHTGKNLSVGTHLAPPDAWHEMQIDSP